MTRENFNLIFLSSFHINLLVLLILEFWIKGHSGHNYEANFKSCFLFLSKKDAETFVRTIYAGNAIMTLKSKDSVKIITVRTTSFEPDESTGGSAATETANAPDAIPNVSKFIGQELSKSDRPELGMVYCQWQQFFYHLYFQEKRKLIKNKIKIEIVIKIRTPINQLQVVKVFFGM